MKRAVLNELEVNARATVLGDLISGTRIVKGGVHAFKPGEVAHAGQSHVHDSEEVFLVLQGKGKLPVDDDVHEVRAGDVIVIEPGENHHMTSGEDDPLVVVWLHIE